jgi:hypothetical protein
MANEIPGINLLVEVGGTAVVAQSNATLSTSTELAEAIVKSTNFTKQNSGDQDWTLSYEGQFTESDGDHALTDGKASLKVGDPTGITAVDDTSDVFTTSEDKSTDWTSGDTVYVIQSSGNNGEYSIASISGTDVTVNETISDSTADGRIFNPDVVPGVQSLSLNLEQELNDVPPGINETVGWTNYVPLRRTFSVEADGHYYDPTDEATYETIHTARDNGDNLGGVVTVMGVDFFGEIAADSMDIEAGTDDNASYSLSWAGSGEIDRNGTAETTIDSLVSLYFDQSTATASLRHVEDGTDVTGSTYWSGTTYLSTLEVALERGEYPELSTELQGDGQLTRNTV